MHIWSFWFSTVASRYRVCGWAIGLRGLCFRSGWLDFAILRNLSGVACHRNHFGRHGERTRKVGREGRCRGMKRHTSLNTLMTCETNVLRGLVSCHIADLSDIHALTQLGRSQKSSFVEKISPQQKKRVWNCPLSKFCLDVSESKAGITT